MCFLRSEHNSQKAQHMQLFPLAYCGGYCLLFVVPNYGSWEWAGLMQSGGKVNCKFIKQEESFKKDSCAQDLLTSNEGIPHLNKTQLTYVILFYHIGSALHHIL